MVDKIKITKTNNSFGKTSKETVEVSGAKLAKQLDQITSKLSYSEKGIEELTKRIEKQRQLSEKNGQQAFSTKDYLDQIKLEQATLGLSRARLMHAEFLDSYERRIKELNKNAYKDNSLYKAYQAVRNENNSPVTAAATNIGLGLASMGMINPVVANALHLDRLITAPITALTHKLLGIGHTTSSAIQNELEEEKTAKIHEIAEGVNKINDKMEKKANTPQKESGGILSFFGNLAMAAAGFFASDFILDKLDAPDLAKKIIPWGVAGFAMGGLPGAILGGAFGFFKDDIIGLVAEYLPKLRDALDKALENLSHWFENDPSVQIIKKFLSDKYNEYSDKVKDTLIDMGLTAAGTTAAMYGTYKGVTKGLPKLLKLGVDTIRGGKTASTTAEAINTFEKGINTVKVANDNLSKAAAGTSKLSKLSKLAKKAPLISGILTVGEADAVGLSAASEGKDIGDAIAEHGFNNIANNWDETFGENRSGWERAWGALGLLNAPFDIAEMGIGKTGQGLGNAALWAWDHTFGETDEERKEHLIKQMEEFRKINKEEDDKDTDGNNLTKRDVGFIEQSAMQLSENLKNTFEDPNGIGMRQLNIQQTIADILQGILDIQTDTYHIEHNVNTWAKNTHYPAATVTEPPNIGSISSPVGGRTF